MALSKCPKCDNMFFETKVAEPAGSAVKLIFVQCSRCGAVVGVTEFFNTASLIQKLAAKLGFKL